MAENPLEKLNWFPIKKGDIVIIHVEPVRDALSPIMHIRKFGAKAVLAIRPCLENRSCTKGKYLEN